MKTKILLVAYFLLAIPLFSQNLKFPETNRIGSKYDYIISNRNSVNYNFYLACLLNDSKYVLNAINSGLDVNCELTYEEDLKLGTIILETIVPILYDDITERFLEEYIEDWHCSPIAAATFFGSNDVAKILIENNANILEKTNYGTGYSLLEICCFTNNYDLFTCLVDFTDKNLIEEIFEQVLDDENQQFIEYFELHFSEIQFSEDLADDYTDYLYSQIEDDKFSSQLIIDKILDLSKKNISFCKSITYSLWDLLSENKDALTYFLSKEPNYFEKNFSQEELDSIVLNILYIKDAEVVEFLITHYPIIKNSIFQSNYITGLHYFIKEQYKKDKFSFLIKNNFNFDVSSTELPYEYKDLFKYTLCSECCLLEYLIIENETEIVHYLLSNKLCKNITENLLPCAISANNYQIVNDLFNYDYVPNSIKNSERVINFCNKYIGVLNLKIIETIKNNDVNINIPDHNEVTLLIGACKKNDYNFIKTLISYGADINYQDSLGNTAITYVLTREESIRYELAELLIEKGADLNIKNNEGRWLISQTYTTDFNMKKLLIDNGAIVTKEYFSFYLNTGTPDLRIIEYLLSKLNTPLEELVYEKALYKEYSMKEPFVIKCKCRNIYNETGKYGTYRISAIPCINNTYDEDEYINIELEEYPRIREGDIVTFLVTYKGRMSTFLLGEQPLFDYVMIIK